MGLLFVVWACLNRVAALRAVTRLDAPSPPKGLAAPASPQNTHLVRFAAASRQPISPPSVPRIVQAARPMVNFNFVQKIQDVFPSACNWLMRVAVPFARST